MKSKVLQRKMFRDPSEDENVGIMQGFMDSLEEMLTGEGDMSEEEDDSPSGAPDRTPRSPEILMNTMRGDMRSVDARVEELADMVGYNAASSTPLEVLALLQPVLKQQGIAALEAAAPAMPDMGMAPPGMPDMGMAPPPGAMGMAPPPTMEGGIGSLPQGNMGQPPMQMARGGPVQYFQTGDEVVAGAVTPVDTRTFSPEVMDMFRQRILGQLEADPTAAAALQPGYLTRRTQELSPEYKTLLGVDPGASKGQMLFDVAQAALNYAGNVNAQGQPMRGSQAARLAGAFSGLPAAIGARASDAQKQNQAIRLAAMQGAQSEIDAARSASISREDTLDKLAIEAMKNSGSTPRPLTTQDKAAYGITGPDANLPWVFDSTGKPMIAGGRAPAPLVNIGERTLEQQVAERAANLIFDQYDLAKDAVGNIRKLDDTIRLIEEGSVDTGFGAELRQNIRGVQGLFNNDPERIKTLTDTQLLNAALGQDVFGSISALGVGARGLDTPAEREFLREVLAGRITLTKDALLKMARMRRTADERNVAAWNDTLGSGRADAVIKAAMGTIPRSLIDIPSTQSAARSSGATPVPAPAVIRYDAQGNRIP